MAKSKVHYFHDRYEFILKDGEAFPPTGVAVGTRILTLPSRRSYTYTGDDWVQDGENKEVAILSKLDEMNQNLEAIADLANQLLDKL